jgi:5'-phosphate synthase pdxT subunit
MGCPPVGVLAQQGAFAAHAAVLRGLGADVLEVRTPAHLAQVAGLVIPGGESGVMMLGIERDGLAEPLREFAAAGRPVLGTCAGLIVLDRKHLDILPIVAERNAFGRQVCSFETDLAIPQLGPAPVHAVFIRAPWVAEHAAGVTVLAEVDGHPVAVEQGPVLAISFHPELAAEPRVHQRFLDSVRARLDA